MRHDLILVALLLASGVARAADHEPAARVAAAIDASLPGIHGQVLPNGGDLMPACRHRLAVKWMSSTDNSFRTAAVSCPAPAWTVYVGVRIIKRKTVLVATKTIPVGGEIDASDAMSKTVTASGLHGSPLRSSQISAGLKANQPISAGLPILVSMTDIPTTVRSGQTVSLTVHDDGVIITTSGIALQSGSIGQTIEVENAESHRKLQATIVHIAPDRSGVYLTSPSAPQY